MKKTIFTIITALLVSASATAYTDEVNDSRFVIEPYKPNLFMVDLSHTYSTSKLQFGFKMRVVKDLNLYFAYSQVMFSQVRAASQPFYDIDFAPEVFYRIPLSKDNNLGLDIGIIEHESNGVDGPNSRSWNRTYIRLFQTWDFGNGFKYYFKVKAWIPYGMDPTSMDLANYRGLYEINLTWADFIKNGWFSMSDLTVRMYPGGPSMVNLFAGAIEVTWRFKPIFINDVLPMFSVQMFYGYAENLRDYKAPPALKFRFGVGF